MHDLKVDELLDKVHSRYGLVIASAKRARQINEYTATLGLNESLGIPGPQVHTRSQHPLSIAIEELREGKLEIGFRERPRRRNPLLHPESRRRLQRPPRPPPAAP